MTARDWRVAHDGLVRELSFRDYEQALRFVDQLAEDAVDYERRPNVSIVEFNRVRIEVENLHHAGITDAERRLAAKVDAFVEHYPGDNRKHADA